MEGKSSWQLLLIGQSRFPADQTHMRCRLKEGERATSKVAGQARLQGWRSGAEQTDEGLVTLRQSQSLCD